MSKVNNGYNSEHSELNEKFIKLIINKDEDLEKITKLGKALSNKDCMRIFQVISEQPLNMSEISKLTGIAISSVSNHIDTLNAAELIHVYYQPSLKGHVKVCNNKALNISILVFSKFKYSLIVSTAFILDISHFCVVLILYGIDFNIKYVVSICMRHVSSIS